MLEDKDRAIKHWRGSMMCCLLVLAAALWSRQMPREGLAYFDFGTKYVTNYRAVTAECDSTPDIGAGGRVAVAGHPTGRWFASNELPFGTKIVIPEITGNAVWTCRDRISKKYPHRVDLLIHKGDKAVTKWAKVYIVKKVRI